MTNAEHQAPEHCKCNTQVRRFPTVEPFYVPKAAPCDATARPVDSDKRADKIHKGTRDLCDYDIVETKLVEIDTIVNPEFPFSERQTAV